MIKFHELPSKGILTIFEYLEARDKLNYLLLNRVIYHLVFPLIYRSTKITFNDSINISKYGPYIQYLLFKEGFNPKENPSDSLKLNQLVQYLSKDCSLYLNDLNVFTWEQLQLLNPFKLISFNFNYLNSDLDHSNIYSLIQTHLFSNLMELNLTINSTPTCRTLLELLPFKLNHLSLTLTDSESTTKFNKVMTSINLKSFQNLTYLELLIYDKMEFELKTLLEKEHLYIKTLKLKNWNKNLETSTLYFNAKIFPKLEYLSLSLVYFNLIIQGTFEKLFHLILYFSLQLKRNFTWDWCTVPKLKKLLIQGPKPNESISPSFYPELFQLDTTTQSLPHLKTLSIQYWQFSEFFLTFLSYCPQLQNLLLHTNVLTPNFLQFELSQPSEKPLNSLKRFTLKRSKNLFFLTGWILRNAPNLELVDTEDGLVNKLADEYGRLRGVTLTSVMGSLLF